MLIDQMLNYFSKHFKVATTALVLVAIFVVTSILYFDRVFSFYNIIVKNEKSMGGKKVDDKSGSSNNNTEIAIKYSLKKFLPAEDQLKFSDSPYWNQIIEKQKEIPPDDQGLTSRVRPVNVAKVLIPNQKYEIVLPNGENKIFVISNDTVLYVPKFKYDEKDNLLGFSREVVNDRTILYTVSVGSKILAEVDDANKYTNDKEITLKSILFAD